MANVPVTAGSGTNIATNAITRDTVTEQMQLVNIGDPATGSPLNISLSGYLTNQPWDSTKATYTATSQGQTAPVALGPVFILTGSATKTVKIRRVTFSAVATTAITLDMSLIKAITNATGGTGTAVNICLNDSANNAATAVATAYTVVPTLSNYSGSFYASKIYVATGSFANLPMVSDIRFDDNLYQPPTLRGAAQQFNIYLYTGLTGGTMDISVVWTEDNT